MIKSKHTVYCELCDNVPGFYCTFPTVLQAIRDAEEKGWLVYPSGFALCPYCRKVKNDEQ